MNHASLFSGIGAPELAAEAIGWNNVMHCEINPFSRKILNYYWPHAASHNDITKTDFSPYRGSIDILTGGFPCQPYSVAGKRLGKEDERHLWPHMLRAIQEIRPRYVVGENVRGIVSWNEGLVFDEVCADLETAGYEVLPFILPACAVNAPHRRERVWFIGHRLTPDSESRRRGFWASEDNRAAAREFDTSGNPPEISLQQSATNSENIGLQRSGISRNGQPGFEDSNFLTTYANGFGLRRQSNGFRKPGFISENGTANYWQNFPTQSPVCSGDDGLSTRLDGITFPKWRNESIKAYGMETAWCHR